MADPTKQRWRYIGVVFPGNVPAALRVWRREGEPGWADDEGEPVSRSATLFLTRAEAYAHAEKLCKGGRP